jgi:hypothetical protein
MKLPANRFANTAWALTPKTENHLLPEGGIYQWKRRGEAHLFNPNGTLVAACNPQQQITTYIKTTPN